MTGHFCGVGFHINGFDVSFYTNPFDLHEKCECVMIKCSGLLICHLLRGYLQPVPDVLLGYIHLLFINLEGITQCSELTTLHKT